jgi:hypothetical protein
MVATRTPIGNGDGGKKSDLPNWDPSGPRALKVRATRFLLEEAEEMNTPQYFTATTSFR